MTRDSVRTIRRRDSATSFVGRRRELADLTAILGADHRMVTLVGPGGIGKTRLAVRLARLRADRDQDVLLVDLAPLSSRGRLEDALLQAVEPGVRARGPALRAAADLIADRRVLVVLDNCEHLAADAEQVARVLLDNCPHAQVLATAREPLRTGGETVWPVPPLSVPAQDVRDHTDAARLFVDRARLARRDVTFPPAILADVDRIVRAVDGIPLAIELAAARVRMLGIHEIADTLNLRMLADGRRGGDPRHRTMCASLDWSYGLLSAAERVLFRRLAVFRGPWTVAAAAAVCADDQLPTDAIGRHLDALVEKTLVVRRDAESGPRYRMLHPIREYAHEPPDSDDPAIRSAVDRDALADRHLSHYLDLAERANLGRWPLVRRRRAELADAAANFHAALEHACRVRPDNALRLAAALGFAWRVTGRLTEGAEATARALAAAPDTATPARAMAQANRSVLLFWQGDLAQAHEVAVEAVDTATRAADPRARAQALVSLAAGLAMAGAEDARPPMRQAVGLARDVGDPVILSDALVGLAMCLTWQEDFAAVAETVEECLAVARPLGFDYAEALALWCQAHEARARLDLPRARALAERLLACTAAAAARERCRDINTFGRNGAVQVLALVAIHEGDPERAKQLVRDELARCARSPVPWGVGVLLQARGYAELAAGEYGDARVTGALLYEHARDGCGALAWRALDIVMRAELAEGDKDAARAHAAEIGRIGDASANRTAEAVGLLGLAHADLLAGDPGSAELRAQEALALARTGVLAHEAACALELIAEVAAVRGQFERAARLLAAASAVAGPRYGATVDSTRASVLSAVEDGLDAATRTAAEAEGAAMSLDDAAAYIQRTRSRRARPVRGWASLTTAEAMVARLAADGLLNPAIAEQLVVARGTVKVHLSRVYAKLGVANRTELAAYLRDSRPA